MSNASATDSRIPDRVVSNPDSVRGGRCNSSCPGHYNGDAEECTRCGRSVLFVGCDEVDVCFQCTTDATAVGQEDHYNELQNDFDGDKVSYSL